MTRRSNELYLTKEQAAQVLGTAATDDKPAEPLSMRRVMDFAHDGAEYEPGRIRRVRQQDPKTLRKVTMLMAADVHKLIKQRQARSAVLAAIGAGQTALPAVRALAAPAASGETSLERVYDAPPAPLAPEAADWLTAEEAEQRTRGRVPADKWEQLAAKGIIDAEDVGIRRGVRGRFRFHVDVVDGYRGRRLNEGISPSGS